MTDTISRHEVLKSLDSKGRKHLKLELKKAAFIRKQNAQISSIRNKLIHFNKLAASKKIATEQALNNELRECYFELHELKGKLSINRFRLDRRELTTSIKEIKRSTIETETRITELVDLILPEIKERIKEEQTHQHYSAKISDLEVRLSLLLKNAIINEEVHQINEDILTATSILEDSKPINRFWDIIKEYIIDIKLYFLNKQISLVKLTAGREMKITINNLYSEGDEKISQINRRADQETDNLNNEKNSLTNESDQLTSDLKDNEEEIEAIVTELKDNNTKAEKNYSEAKETLTDISDIQKEIDDPLRDTNIEELNNKTEELNKKTEEINKQTEKLNIETKELGKKTEELTDKILETNKRIRKINAEELPKVLVELGSINPQPEIDEINKEVKKAEKKIKRKIISAKNKKISALKNKKLLLRKPYKKRKPVMLRNPNILGHEVNIGAKINKFYTKVDEAGESPNLLTRGNDIIASLSFEQQKAISTMVAKQEAFSTNRRRKENHEETREMIIGAELKKTLNNVD